MKRDSFRDECGQSAILIALAMLALIAFIGLIIDGGDAYLTRRDAQNASDAGAFAGAQALRADFASDATVRAAINSFVQANHVANAASDVTAYYLNGNLPPNDQITGCQVGSCGSIPNGATGVVVTSTIAFNSLFISVVTGPGSNRIPARAKVQTGQLTAPASPVVPMAVPIPIDCNPNEIWDDPNGCGRLQKDTAVDLFGTTTGSGNLQWLNLGAVDPDPVSPCNENCIASYIAQDTTPVSVKVGDWLYPTTGVSVNKCSGHQTKDTSIVCAIDYWLDKPFSERRWITPIFQITRGTGNTLRYQVIAFAAFYPTGYNLGNGSGWTRGFANGERCIDPFTLEVADNNTKCIKGKFEGFTMPGSVDPTKECNVNALNICGIQLWE